MTGLGYAFALAIGLSLGLLGGGGSILTVPVLVYLLGYDMKLAVPMSLVVVGVTSAFGVLTHNRAGHIRWGAVASFGAAAMLGAFLGAELAARVSSRFQLQLFAVMMLAAAISMYFGASLWGGAGRTEESRVRPWPLIAGSGALVGGLTGLIGIGGGFMYVPALVVLGGLGIKQAIGTSLALIVVSCVAGLLGHLDEVGMPWGPIALFTGLAIAGVVAGSALARRVTPEKLRKGFAVFLLLMGIFVFLRPG